MGQTRQNKFDFCRFGKVGKKQLAIHIRIGDYIIYPYSEIYNIVNERYIEKAFEYFKKAADQNHYEAILSVGLYYYFGEVVEKNDILALEYINKSYLFT